MAEFGELDWRTARLQAEALRADMPRRKSEGDRRRALDTLRDSVGASLDLALRDKSRCQDDTFLQRFLYARKHDPQESFKLLVRYYSYRQRNPELWLPADGGVLRALADSLPGALPARDRRGRCVLVLHASNWCPAACPLIAVYRALLLTLEKALEDVQNLANGFVIVVDWTEFTFKQSCNLNPKTLKLIVEGLQDCFPARFKGVHFVGQPWYVETALAVLRPFLRGKTRERIFLHGNNLSTLHDYLPLDILPAELGGECPSYNPERWLRLLFPAEATPVLSCPVTKPAACPAARQSLRRAVTEEPQCAKLDRGYIKTDVSFFSNNNGCCEKGAKAGLLNDRD